MTSVKRVSALKPGEALKTIAKHVTSVPRVAATEWCLVTQIL